MMPAPRPFVNIDMPDNISEASPTRKRRTFKQHPLPEPRVTVQTRERLYQEAYAFPGCEGMSQADIRAWVDGRLTAYLAKQPYWYGHTGRADTAHRASHRQYEARRQHSAS